MCIIFSRNIPITKPKLFQYQLGFHKRRKSMGMLDSYYGIPSLLFMLGTNARPEVYVLQKPKGGTKVRIKISDMFLEGQYSMHKTVGLSSLVKIKTCLSSLALDVQKFSKTFNSYTYFYYYVLHNLESRLVICSGEKLSICGCSHSIITFRIPDTLVVNKKQIAVSRKHLWTQWNKQ